MDLVAWRDKSGQPHEIIHSINAYFSDEMCDPEPIMNLSEPPSDGLRRGSGRIQNTEYKKEKGEQDHHAPIGHGATIELPRSEEPSRKRGPRPQTLASLDRLGP